MLAFIDVEASSLVNGYPIEIGWARADGQVGAVLIRPHTEWDVLNWDHNAEKIHGLARDQVDTHGILASEAVRYLNAALAGCQCSSDAPGFDWRWMSLLLEFADIEPRKFSFDLLTQEADALVLGLSMRDAGPRVERAAISRLIDRTQQRRPHSAAGDAVRWMCALELGRGGGQQSEAFINEVIRVWDSRAIVAAPWRRGGGA